LSASCAKLSEGGGGRKEGGESGGDGSSETVVARLELVGSVATYACAIDVPACHAMCGTSCKASASVERLPARWLKGPA